MSSPFVKQLVASDRKTRDAALASLTKFLSSSRPFQHMELMKLWKGLFYCFWHSDRTLVQQALANDLANLCLTVRDVNVIPFLRAFWATMCREWNSIDILRLDKFYTLLRRFVGAAFKKLWNRQWDETLLSQYLGLLEELPLSATDQKMPNGIRYHLADIYMEELAKVVPKEEEQKSVPINDLLRPFELIITQSPTKAVRLRVMKAVFQDKRLTDFGYEAPLSDSENSDEASDASADESLDDEEFTGFD